MQVISLSDLSRLSGNEWKPPVTVICLPSLVTDARFACAPRRAGVMLGDCHRREPLLWLGEASPSLALRAIGGDGNKRIDAVK